MGLRLSHLHACLIIFNVFRLGLRFWRRPTVWDCVLKICCMNVIINTRLRSRQAQLGITILCYDLIIVRHDNGWLLGLSAEERLNRSVQREFGKKKEDIRKAKVIEFL